MDGINLILNGAPKITKVYIGIFVVIILLSWLDILSFVDLYYNNDLIFQKKQYWRLVTSFFFLGNFSIGVLFYLLIL